jgi:hypothetical protein|tara:strand:- start:978 stop:1391 length:414 start_codon:yes stop_codon:yes gene_type:complete
MAHFAKINSSGIVEEVNTVANEVLHDSNGIEQEVNGINFLTELTGHSLWKQTSYNTYGGVHKLGGTPLRKNYASIGWTYDENKDAFIAPKPYNSWVYNENTADWDPPVERPDESTLTDNQCIHWNESTLEWEIENRT